MLPLGPQATRTLNLANVLPLVILGGGAVISLLPTLYLSPSAFPSADDYCLAVEAFKGPLHMQVLMYREWTGRFAASFLQASVSQWDLAGVYPWFCAATFVATGCALYAFIRAMTRGERSRIQAGVAALVAMAVLVDGMPSVTEAFFWMASATTYQWSLIAYLVWVTLLTRIIATGPTDWPAAARVGATILTVLLPGFNEVMMPVVLATVASFALAAHRYRLPGRRLTLALLGLALGATAAALFAPGNAIRSQSYPAIPTRHNLSFALGETALQTLRFVVQYGLSVELWTFAAVTWWWASRTRMRVMNALRYFPLGGTWGFGLVLALVIYLTLFPLYWEYGTNNYTGEGRTYNVTYAVFCIFVIWLVWTVLSEMTPRWPEATKRLRIHHQVVEWTLATSLAFLMIGSPGTAKAFRAAMVAPQYLREQQHRESILRASDNQQKAVVVNALRVKPDGIFWGDIQPDATHWINSCVANYYGVGSVRTPSHQSPRSEPGS